MDASHRLRIAGLALGTVVAAVGAVALIGWWLRLPGLVQPVGYTPIHANDALGLIACGVGCIGLALRRPRLTMGAGLVTLLIGGATFAQFIFGLNLGIDTLIAEDFLGRGRFHGRMPAVSAAALSLVGLSLVVLATARRPGLRYSFVGVLGAGVTALALVDLFVGATRVLGTVRQGFLLGAARPEMIALLLVGALLTWLAWERDSTQPEVPRWAPIAGGLGVLMTTVFIWRALVVEQNQLLDARVAEEAATIQRSVTRRLDELRELTRLLARQAAVAVSPRAWQQGAAQVADLAWELDSLIWRGVDGDVRAVVPDDTATAMLRRAPVLRRRAAAGDTSVAVRVADTPDRFAVSASVCAAGSCDGTLTAVASAADLLDHAFVMREMSVDVAIGREGRVFYTIPRDVSWTGSSAPRRPLGPPALGWTMQVAPGAALGAAIRTTMPEVLLGLGTLLAVLLTITLRLAQTAFERARGAERERLARVLESGTDGVWEWDVRDGVVERSRSIWERLGYDPDEVGSGIEAWTSRIHPDDRGRYDAAVRAHLDGRAPAFSLEYRIRAADGEWHWIVDQGRIVQHTTWGQPERVLGVIGNITERKRADAVLAESEQRFRAIFESGMYFQTLLDLDCRVTEANPAMLEFAGLARDDVRGHALWDAPWWPPERRLQLQRACEEAREGRTVQLQDDIRGAGNRAASIEYSIRPIRSRDGTVVQLLFEGRDVTERKRAEAVLREMNTLTTMGRLAAHVAHEINNPLAGIQNSFLLIRDAIPESHPHYAYVGAIEREMARIARVTRQLYETYRQGQEEDNEASLAVEAGDAVGLLTQLNRSKQVSITLDTTGVPAVVPIPGAIVRQTLFNLVQNAVDASPPGGSVGVRAWTEGQTLHLSVSDEGPGVAEELRERVFEPFFSTKSNLRTGGMGIGLSIVRRSIEALGGRVWITGEGGSGATFQVEIPLLTLEPARGDHDGPRSHSAG